MKYVVQFHFYLDSMLPRDSDWQPWAVDFEKPGQPRARVIIRGNDEEIFGTPNDAAILTANVGLVRLAAPHGMLTKAIAACDRVTVLIWGDGDTHSDELEYELLQSAVGLANSVLSRLRVISECANSPLVRRELRSQDGRFYVTSPHSVGWFHEEGHPWPVHGGIAENHRVNPGAIRAPLCGALPFTVIQDALKREKRLSLSQSLLLDAEEHLQVGRQREAIISLSGAMEVATNQLMERFKVDPTTKSIKDILSARESFAKKRLCNLTSFLCNRSLRDESPELFELAKETYTARNAIIHQGQDYDDSRRCLQYVEAVKSILKWILALG